MTPFHAHAHRHGWRLAPLAAALVLAFAPLAPFTSAHAEDNTDLSDLLTPDSRIRLGVGYLGQDSPRLGQYNGLDEKGSVALLDFSLVRRNANGYWVRASGKNLGLDSREARVGVEQQGQWALFADYNRIPRLEPVAFQSSLLGVGTADQTVRIAPVAAAAEVQLGTLRERVTLGFDKTLAPGVDLQVRYQFEDKTGTRLFGRGGAQFLAEPIDSKHQQLEVNLGYVGKQLQLQAGYLGSLFVNRVNALRVNVVNTATTTADIALAPDNQQHQFFVSGGYTLAPGTRSSFKFTRTVGTQNEGFFTAPDFAGNSATSLNARLETTQGFASLSSRLSDTLNLLAQLRHEERRDKTPRVQFLPATTGRDGFNTPFSRRNTTAKLEAQWQGPLGVRLVGGFDHDDVDRSTLAIRQASWRENNHEGTWRVEARASLAETLNGSLAYLNARRRGSDYLVANNNAAADFIDPLHFADRDREKVRLQLDWAPVEPLSLQLNLEQANDRFHARPLGPQRGRQQGASLDATWTLSEAWQFSAWATRDENRSAQLSTSGANGAQVAAQTWRADLRTIGDALGLGLRARPLAKLETGVDFTRSRDLNRYNIQANVPAAALLPDINTKRQNLRVFAAYELQRHWSLRVEAGTERWRSNDWTWTGWTYADGSTAVVRPQEKADFLGLSVVYQLR